MDDTPSWEKSIQRGFEQIENDLKKYFKTEHMMFEWCYWGTHNGGVCSRYRRKVREILGLACYVKNVFPIKSKTLDIILNVIDHSLCAQLNLTYKMVKDCSTLKKIKHCGHLLM